ncbi:hypothetical protein [Ferrimonas senticii]|uniref:hypothetical protein n=1 Tax=Ferrimonas senticii TaxID=394566 RepID=UPI000412A0FA|nr:hypothetical protein [Ferrimonas senticii]
MMNPVQQAKADAAKQRESDRQQLQQTYQQTPEQGLEQLQRADDDGLYLVDFDETLWLRNSTEMFLASIQPSWWAAIIIQLLGLLKPWRWFGDEDPEHRRDWIRLKVVLALCPGAVKRWQQQAPQLAAQHLNQQLVAVLRQKPQQNIRIVSFGFDFVLQPLLQALECSWPLQICLTMDDAVAIRERGKAQILTEQLGELALRRAVCITDSLLDRDLLAAVNTGILVKWPLASGDPAGMAPMLPLVFTKKVNRPTEQYFTRVILGHDYIGLVLAFVLVSSQPLLCAISLLLFVLAYFAIYETGYFENDRLGLLFEEKPRVSEQFKRLGHNFNPNFAWLCGLIIAIPAAYLASLGSSWLPAAFGVTGAAAVLAVWLTFVGFMVAVRTVFYWFNRTPVQGRILPMLLLQFARNCGYIVLFPTIISGGIFCLAWTLGKWVPYIIYRYGGSAMGYPNHLVTGLLFASMMLMVGLSSSAGFTPFVNWPTALISLYVGARAGKDLWSFRSRLKPLTPIAGRQIAAVTDNKECK